MSKINRPAISFQCYSWQKSIMQYYARERRMALVNYIQMGALEYLMVQTPHFSHNKKNLNFFISLMAMYSLCGIKKVPYDVALAIEKNWNELSRREAEYIIEILSSDYIQAEVPEGAFYFRKFTGTEKIYTDNIKATLNPNEIVTMDLLIDFRNKAIFDDICKDLKIDVPTFFYNSAIHRLEAYENSKCFDDRNIGELANWILKVSTKKVEFPEELYPINSLPEIDLKNIEGLHYATLDTDIQEAMKCASKEVIRTIALMKKKDPSLTNERLAEMLMSDIKAVSMYLDNN